MKELLTAREVKELLKIDRTTLYRMLNDGRIKGVKIGSQWRFDAKELEAVINQSPVVDTAIENPRDVLPLHCIEPIQDVFSDMAQIASVTTDAEGIPLSKFSNTCSFCTLILASEKGKEGCYNSWKKFNVRENKKNQFATCHAGLNYAKADIKLEDKKVAMLIAGQFYINNRNDEEVKERIKKLANDYGINYSDLANAEKEITVIDERIKLFIDKWLDKVAKSFETIGRERKELISRLKNIAEISSL
jgi:excisionase family DNA binding protein